MLCYSVLWHGGHRVWLHRWTGKDDFIYEFASHQQTLPKDEFNNHAFNAEFDAAQRKAPHWGHPELSKWFSLKPGGNMSHDTYKGDEPRRFEVKDSGERKQFDSGMVRDTAAGKLDWWRVYVGPMLKRLAVHVTKGAVKYPDVKPGVPNWTLAAGPEELQRYRESAARHFAQWMDGDQDEDHAAAVVFNLNGYEYVKERMACRRDELKAAVAALPKSGLEPGGSCRVATPQEAAREPRTISRGTPLNLPLISEMPVPKGDPPARDEQELRAERRHPFLGEVRHPRAR